MLFNISYRQIWEEITLKVTHPGPRKRRGVKTLTGTRLTASWLRAEETMDSTPNRPTVSFEELVYSNMLTLNALIELLDERGLIGKTEIL